ncbi:hypothetical protein ACC724_37745, partial [Rhizobium ruizarguesonis]
TGASDMLRSFRPGFQPNSQRPQTSWSAETSPSRPYQPTTGFNGFEAARLIRQMEETGDGTHTPIIGVLNQAFERDRAECVKSGMDDVIMKPVSPDMLEMVFQK